MAALCSRNGSLESGNAGTHHHHLLALTCRHHLHTLYLTTNQRIDGTTTGEGNRTLSHTSVATQALHDAVFLSSHYLLRMERIGQQLTGHIHHIGLSLSDDTFHLLRIAQRTNRSHRLLHVFLNLCSQPYVHAVFVEHRRRGVEESELIGTC